MKAKQKKLKGLNEQYLRLRDEFEVLTEQAHSAPANSMNMQLDAIRVKLTQVEQNLHIALTEVMRELGPVYKEIGRIMFATGEQTPEEFEVYLRRIIGSIPVDASASELSLYFGKAKEVAEMYGSFEEELNEQESLLDNWDNFKGGALPMQRMIQHVQFESERARARLEELTK